jgi:hypothetical protein
MGSKSLNSFRVLRPYEYANRLRLCGRSALPWFCTSSRIAVVSWSTRDHVEQFANELLQCPFALGCLTAKPDSKVMLKLDHNRAR